MGQSQSSNLIIDMSDKKSSLQHILTNMKETNNKKMSITIINIPPDSLIQLKKEIELKINGQYVSIDAVERKKPDINETLRVKMTLRFAQNY